MIALGIRYLLSRKRQTLLTLLGVYFAGFAYVTISGMFIGFQGYMIEQLVDTTAQVHIAARQDYLTEHQLDEAFYEKIVKHVFWTSPPSGVVGYLEVQNPQSWYERLKADPRVQAYSPLIVIPALFTLNKISVSTNLIGCDPEQQAKVTSIAEYMLEGQFADIAAGGNRLILGSELMKQLGAGIGHYIQVTAGAFASVPFKVVGSFSLGNRAIDLQAYGQISDVQRLYHKPNRVTEIAVRLGDYNQAAPIATNWSKISPERVESWDQQNANILSLNSIRDFLRYGVILIVVLVSGFGIYNVLNMTVTQKRRDIAILRSMGADTFDIIALFFSQGLILGITGGFFGLASGYFACRYLRSLPFSGGGFVHATYLPVLVTPAIYVQAMILALLTASIASVLPARAASKLTPIEIIRAGE